MASRKRMTPAKKTNYLRPSDEADLGTLFHSAVTMLRSENKSASVVAMRDRDSEMEHALVIVVTGELAVREAAAAIERLMDRWDKKAEA
jgi:hypothetical protein